MIDLEKYKTGFRYSKNYEQSFICSCGNAFSHKWEWVCPKCENRNFIEIKTIPKSLKKIVGVHYEVLEKSRDGFKVKKIDIIAKINEFLTKIDLEAKDSWTLEVDYTKNESKIIKKRNESINNNKDLKLFFKHYNTHQNFIELIAPDGKEEYYKKMENLYGRYYYEMDKITATVTAIIENPKLEILHAAGINIDILHQLTLNQDETKPHKIIGVPKFVLQDLEQIAGSYIRDYEIKRIREAEKTIGINHLKTVLDILKTEGNIRQFIDILEIVENLYVNYDYKDVKKLMLYITRDVKFGQGITNPQNAIQYLRDYANMSKKMNMDWNRYSKSLKKDHDITTMNYNTKKDEIKRSNFKKAVEKENYQNLAFEDDEYVIVPPKELDEVIDEGKHLSHCVASYVDDIIDERCKILFLRKKGNENESLVTIEEKGEKVVQAKGRSNREVSKDEKLFIENWAKEKELKMAIY
jgi:hypothetical protein